jgi:uncharacterized protein (TIGR03437 family)
MRTKIIISLLVALPMVLFGFHTGPPIKRTGAAIDGGTTCTACHSTFAPANSDARGSVTIEAGSYKPGVTQTIKVTLKHPDATRWGFQLTARLRSDQTKQAGTFAVNDVVRVRCDTAPAQDAPCSGALEFPEHKDAPFTNAGVGFTFSVEWTPPATDAGDIVLFAAGNAANGDGTPAGDRIFTTSQTISAGCSFTQKPTIRSVVNGGSFQPGIAPNSMVTIFGSGFQSPGQTRLVQANDFESGGFPKKFGCIAVEIDGKRVPISYVQADQINAQAPTGTNFGSIAVRVIANADQPAALPSDPASTTMSVTAPSFFTFGASRSIAAQFANSADIVASPTVVPGAKPAKPGDIVTLYGTGFGVTDPVYQAGEIPSRAAPLTVPMTITIGGTTLTSGDILYAGLSPGSISGLYQFNVKLPATVADGDIPVSVQIGGSRTQEATLAVKR